MAHAQSIDPAPSTAPAAITDAEEITRIVNAEQESESPGRQLHDLHCNSEWICALPWRAGLYFAFDPVTHRHQLTSDETRIDLLLVGDDRQLEVLGRLARAVFPQDTAQQSAWIGQKVSDAEQKALNFVLGMTAGGQSGYAGGGVAISITQAPFAAEIRYRDSLVGARASFLIAEPQKYGKRWQARHQCGGTLIDHDWVLTAAHCIKPGSVRGFLAVQLGVTDVSKPGGHQVDVDGAVVHSGYNRGGHLDDADGFDKKGDIYHDDIALLHLARDPIPRDPARIVPAIPDYARVRSGIKAEAVGWGRSNKEGPDTINVTAVLQHVDLTLFDNDACKRMRGYGIVRLAAPNGQSGTTERIHDGVLCVKGAGQKTCDGDSGGPLFYRNSPADRPRLIGIVSVNKSGCDFATDDRPGIYTRISAYRDWIGAAMQTHPKSGQTILLPKVPKP